MHHGTLVFAQLMQHLPLTTFRRCVTRYRGERKVRSFSCPDQFLRMAFAQLTFRESLRDIEACVRAHRHTAVFFSPDEDDESGVGIANVPLPLTARPESWKGEQQGERLGVFHRSSWTTATRSLPQISDKIRGLAALDQTQSGCGVGRPHALSFIHFHVRRAGIDLAKHVFQLHGVDARGRAVVSRCVTRSQLLHAVGRRLSGASLTLGILLP